MKNCRLRLHSTLGNSDEILRLLEEGADVNSADLEHYSPLMLLLKHSPTVDEDMASLMVTTYGASTN